MDTPIIWPAPPPSPRATTPKSCCPQRLTYLDGVESRTPSVANLLRTWPLLFGQPFDLKAALGFIRASATTGFGTSRGMLWTGPRPVDALHDGAPLPRAPDWTVLATPGRTDDHIALWNADTKTLLSGDAVINVRGRPRFAPETVDEAAERTRQHLTTLPVEHLLPGHGPPRSTRARSANCSISASPTSGVLLHRGRAAVRQALENYVKESV